MDVTTIALDKSKAAELYQEYKSHRHYSTPIDDEIRKTYKLISQGKVVIQAVESIKQAGLDAKGLPKLAIARAVEQTCFFEARANGSCAMCGASWARGHGRRDDRIRLPAGSFPFPTRQRQFRDGTSWTEIINPRAKALLPLVPVHLRPRQALHAYHILWEAEWEPVPPRDPYLLRRIGEADLWLVVAAWDLTDVERAALATRITAQ